ncbi:MAG: hypothetical protein KC713_06365 [Candidatus Omnitrophica bacterium]|nr:hypothetical protein [Candidatus Omnitrophota bacterium]
MKALWLKSMTMNAALFKICTLSIILLWTISAASAKGMTRKEALLIAEATPEAEGLYSLNEGRYQGCIEKSVLRPCDTDWVTCIENAWVVKFWLGEQCGIAHDGRLSVTFLIDEDSGKIISKFPEKEYFQNDRYCVEAFDCLSVIHPHKVKGCLNFIAGQLPFPFAPQEGSCQCIDSQCVVP